MRNKISIYLIVLVTLFASCKKNLQLTPSDSIDDTKAFLSVSDLEKGLLGVYSANNPTNRIYLGAILSDEVRLSSENRGQGQIAFKYQYTAGDENVTPSYSSCYAMLDRLHRVLAAFNTVPATTTTDINLKAKIKAELMALRGVAYYELLIRYANGVYDANALGVPIILESNVTAKLPRSSVGQVVAQIESDLATARADAQIPSNSSTDVTRISKAAIAVYQARIALWKKDWVKAITFASDAITLSGKTLVAGTAYAGIWSDATTEAETIWKYRNNSAPQLLWRDSNGDVFFEPSVKLKSVFNRTSDYRFNTFIATSTVDDTSTIKKYPGSTLGPQINDLKLARLSEMYLLRAEAYAENNQLTESSNDYNAVRNVRITGNAPVTFSSISSAVDAVLEERFRELCFEGFRFFDLKRRGLPVQRNSADVQSSAWLSLPANNFRFTLPIPQDEINANNNNVQNPGY